MGVAHGPVDGCPTVMAISVIYQILAMRTAIVHSPKDQPRIAEVNNNQG
jgi:hypothetical protein